MVVINYNPMWGGYQEYDKAVDAIKSIAPLAEFKGITQRASWGSEFKVAMAKLNGK